MEIVVEIAEPGRRAPSIKRFSKSEILIGRAWQADLVVVDAEADGLHAKLHVDPELETFQVEDLGSANGTRINSKRIESSSSANFGDLLTIGQTNFRVHRKYDPVAPAKIHSQTEQWLQRLGHPMTALTLAGIAIFLVQYFEYLGSGAQFEWNNQLQGLISIAVGLAVWATLWGGITKLLKHQFKVAAHLGLAAGLIIASLALAEFESILRFNLLSPSATELIRALGIAFLIFSWIALALVITANLRVRTRLSVAGSLAGLFLLSSFLLPQLQTQNWVNLVPLETKSLPPSLRIAPEISNEDFFQRIDQNILQSEERAAEVREDNESE